MAWTYWEIDPENIGTHHIGLRSVGATHLTDDPDEENITAWVKWDGCTFVTDNRPMPYHQCDLDDEIGRWTELKAIALDYFGGEFAIGGMTDQYVADYLREHR